MSDDIGWRRYWPTADIVLEFDDLVTAVGRDGRARVTRTQYLQAGERFRCLPDPGSLFQ